MVPVYLIGGGGDHPERADTYGRFWQAATRDSRRRVALVVAASSPDEAQETFAYTRAIFTSVGAEEDEVSGLFLSANDALSPEQIGSLEPTGVFVCGGSTPLYHQALCEDRSWLDYLRRTNTPYGGVSAGAAVAATEAIVGGWQANRGGRTRAVLYQGASEGLDMLDVRPGLGLVPFAVEIHASQWGTLTRLLHSVDLGLVSDGWAIDENTMLQTGAASIRIFGPGQAYHLWKGAGGAAQISVHTEGDFIPRHN